MDTTKTIKQVREEAIEEVLSAAFRMQGYKSGGELDAIAEEGTQMLVATSILLDALQSHAEFFERLLVRVGDCNAPTEAKKAMIEAWRPALSVLKLSLCILGRQ